MATRFKRSKDKEEIFRQLASSDDAPFVTFKDVFMMAAILGYNLKKQEQLASGGEQIAWEVFSGATDQAMLNAIALCDSGNFEILLDTDEMTDQKFKTLEEYANAGLDIIKDKVLDRPGNPLDNLIDFILSRESDNSSSLDRSILGDMNIEF